MYEIKKTDSIPGSPRGAAKYPFGKMDVNTYFQFNKEDLNKVASAASNYGKRHGMKFSSRTIDGECFCYRIG